MKLTELWRPHRTAFRETWERLADEGRCDSIDASEYRRIVRQWIAAGCPSDTEEFIDRHAHWDLFYIREHIRGVFAAVGA